MRLLITIFFLSLSTTAFSQQYIVDELASDMERSKAMSLSYIEAMPADQFGFQPNEQVRTFAAQYLHLAQGLIGLSSNGTGATPIFQGENLEATEAYHTKEEVLRIVTESYDFAIKSIKEMDASQLTEIVQRGQFEVTRRGWIHKALEHNTHHKGQTTIYLRMNGITPPQYQLF
ncbi:DinB family protein [Gracilimonas sp. BCB1]|uniref:DinB family protein n=1 Tax=Gracilimonas sp. BCB1 TaxID=3152362 RepID=UPI0032D8D056